MANTEPIISQSLTHARFGVLKLDITGEGEKTKNFNVLNSKGTRNEMEIWIKSK